MKRLMLAASAAFAALLVIEAAGWCQDDQEKKAKPGTAQPGFPEFTFPNIEDLLKDLKGLDAEQKEKLRERLEKARTEIRNAMQKMREEMKKGFAEGKGFAKRPFPIKPLQEPGRLGIWVHTPDEVLAEQLNLPAGKGLIVDQITPESPAAKLGLQKHDILLDIGGKAVPSDPRELRNLLQDIKSGTSVDVQVLRKGKRETLKGLTLSEAK
jgi:C-terminal processing protease CtpA/Prc